MRVLKENTLTAVKEYNLKHQKEHGLSPSYRKVMHALGLGSLATVRRYVLELERRGELERNEYGNISLMPRLRQSEVTLAPLIGRIACGQPNSTCEDYEETYALPKTIFGNGELFLLRAFGNSMIDAGINENDLLVLRRQTTALDGEIVVALVDGETTLKRIYHKNGKIVLHPENREMKDIIVNFCEIQGVLVSCIKIY